jgi:hypothetical protein
MFKLLSRTQLWIERSEKQMGFWTADIVFAMCDKSLMALRKCPSRALNPGSRATTKIRPTGQETACSDRFPDSEPEHMAIMPERTEPVGPPMFTP